MRFVVELRSASGNVTWNGNSYTISKAEAVAASLTRTCERQGLPMAAVVVPAKQRNPKAFKIAF